MTLAGRAMSAVELRHMVAWQGTESVLFRQVVCVHPCVCACMCVCMRACVHACMCACVHVWRRQSILANLLGGNAGDRNEAERAAEQAAQMHISHD